MSSHMEIFEGSNFMETVLSAKIKTKDDLSAKTEPVENFPL